MATTATADRRRRQLCRSGRGLRRRPRRFRDSPTPVRRPATALSARARRSAASSSIIAGGNADAERAGHRRHARRSADYRGFFSPRRSLQLRAVQPSCARAARRVRQLAPGVQRQRQLPRQGDLQQPPVGEPGGAPAAFVGPDAGNGNLLDRISIDVTTRSIRSAYARASRRQPTATPALHRPPPRRRRAAPLLPDRRHLLRRGDARRLVRARRQQLVLGRERHLTAATTPSRPSSATSTPGTWRRRSGPVAACTAPCVPFNIFGGDGLDHAGDARLRDLRPARPQQAAAARRDRQLSGDLFDLPGGPLGIAVGYEHRDQKGSFDPDPIIAAGLRLGHPRAAERRPLQRRRGLRRDERAAARDRPFADLLELNGAARHSNYSTSGDDDVQGRASTGSRSRICCCAASMPRASARRASANCSARRRASTRRSTTPARSAARAPTAVAANCIAVGVPAAATPNQPAAVGDDRRKRDLDPETSETGSSARC